MFSMMSLFMSLTNPDDTSSSNSSFSVSMFPSGPGSSSADVGVNMSSVISMNSQFPSNQLMLILYTFLGSSFAINIHGLCYSVICIFLVYLSLTEKSFWHSNSYL